MTSDLRNMINRHCIGLDKPFRSNSTFNDSLFFTKYLILVRRSSEVSMFSSDCVLSAVVEELGLGLEVRLGTNDCTACKAICVGWWGVPRE